MKIRYKANCIEAGEQFFFTFISEETDPRKLKRIGMEGAAGWGGECISVEKDMGFFFQQPESSQEDLDHE